MNRPRGLIQDFNVAPASNASAGDPIEVELDEPAGNDLIDGALVQENEDGTVDIDLEPAPAAPATEIDFDANLADLMGDEADAIAAELCDAIEEDDESRAEWSGTLADGLKLMGTKIDKRTKPFNGACGVYDPMMAEAVIRFWAIAHAEILPAKGPTKTAITGITLPQTSDQATRVRDWMNFYFTKLAPEYYPDMDQLIFWLGLAGSMFKSVYQDPIKGRPVAPFIMPQDFIVPYSAVSLEDAPRATLVMHMNRREIRLRQLKGIWRDITLTEPVLDSAQSDPLKQQIDTTQGVRPPSQWRGDEIFDVYQTAVDLDLTRFKSKLRGNTPDGLPLPYKITIDKTTKKALALHRNWRKGDTSFAKRNSVVHYKMLPGFGFYGFGYAHVLGSLSTTGTSLRRQIVDAQTLSMFPGGLRVKGMRFDNNNKMIGPTEFAEIDTAGLPINQAVMMMPYKEISNVPLATLQFNSESARNLASNIDIAVGEGRQDAPVGTTLALMEGATRVSTSSLRLFHQSYREELALFHEEFGAHLPDAPYPFPVPGGQSAIMRADFNDKILVIPVSDPDIVTQTQRIMRAEAKLRLAMQAPQIHDLRETYKGMYQSMGMDEQEINTILPPPQQAQPMDPLSENMAAITGGQLKAGEAQDHQAHIEAHTPLGEIPAMQAHIAEHMALQMRQQVQRILGIPLPPPGTPMPPEVENQIAVLTAKAMKAWKQEQGESITPDQIVLAQLQQEATKIANDLQAKLGQIQVKSYGDYLKFITAERDRKQRAVDNMVSAASGASDNMNPPTDYISQVLELGKKAADIDHVVAKTEQVRNPPAPSEGEEP